MPDLSDFAGAIAGAASAAPPKKAPAIPKTGFSSGLAVPKIKPGVGIKAVARTFREKVQQTAGAKATPQFLGALQQIEDTMPKMLTAVEGEMTRLKFAPRDMGNAYAFVFLTLHDDATGTETPEKQSVVAARTLSTAVARYWGPKFKTLAPAQKEQMYESLIGAAILNSLFIKAFEQAGKKDEAATMRNSSAQLFQTLVGVPPTQVEIGPDGQLSGLKADDAPAETPPTDAPGTDTPVTGAPMTDAPAQ